MGKLMLGSNDVDNIYLGDNQVKIFFGDTPQVVELKTNYSLDKDFSTLKLYKGFTGDGTTLGNRIINTGVFIDSSNWHYEVEVKFRKTGWLNNDENLLGTFGNSYSKFRIGLNRNNHLLYVCGWNVTYLTGTTEITLNQDHIVKLLKSGNNVELYLDGNLEATNTISVSTNGGELLIGTYGENQNTLYSTFLGQIYSVKMTDTSTEKVVLDFERTIEDEDGDTCIILNGDSIYTEFKKLPYHSLYEDTGNTLSGANPVKVEVPIKYGAKITDLLGGVDGNGNYQLPTERFNLNFAGVVGIPVSYSFNYKFYKMNNIDAASFPDLTSISGTYAFNYAFFQSSITSISMPNLETASSNAFYQAFYGCSSLTGDVFLDNLTNVETYAFASSFYGTNITKFSANSLESVTKNYAFYGFLYNATNPNLKVYFNGLKSISATSAFNGAFNNSKIAECEFNELETVSGSGNFSGTFNNSNGTLYRDKVFHWRKLRTIDGITNFSSAFSYIRCKRIVFDSLEGIGTINASTYSTFSQACNYASMLDGSNIDKQGLFFPVLTTIGQNSTSSSRNFQNVMTNSNNRHSLHFYELTTIYNENTNTSYGQFGTCNAVRVYMPKVTNMGTKNQYCFNNSSLTQEIHFGIENQATIQAMTGYASKFGATNSTIYFDMVNHITVDGVVYDRDGAKCDLDNWYFAWTNGTTTIYTTNFKDPAINDTVYMKSGDTYTASGTISAIS